MIATEFLDSGNECWTIRTRVGAQQELVSVAIFAVVASAPAFTKLFHGLCAERAFHHAVRMNIPPSSEGRRVVRGFIRSGSNQQNCLTLETSSAGRSEHVQVPQTMKKAS